MGVHIGYSDGSGKRREFNLSGIPTGADAEILGRRKRRPIVPDNILEARNPKPVNPLAKESEGKVKLNDADFRPGTLAEKLEPNGSVVVGSKGLCLRGEERNALIAGIKFYSSRQGEKGFFSIEEIDPDGKPAYVGAKPGDVSPIANTEATRKGEQFIYQVASRIVAERDRDTGVITFYEMDKDVGTSGMGRTTNVTGERRRMIISFAPGGGDAVGRPQPYEVRWAQDILNGQGSWIIWLPGGELLMVGETFVDVRTGLSSAGDDYPGWYVLEDATLSRSTGGTLYLDIDLSDPTESSFSGGAGPSGAGRIAFPVCTAAVSTGAGQRSVMQYVTSAVVVGNGAAPDGKSVGFTTEDQDGDDDGNGSKLQIKDFDNGESDSPAGLAERLSVDKETGKVSVRRGTNIMLVARRDGKVVYIPLSADGDDPEDDDPDDDGRADPCGHPGDPSSGGGVPSDGADGAPGASDVPFGGVPAGGDSHTGDDNCNCE